MEQSEYTYRFSSELDIAELQATLTLAIMATESLHGESRVRLEAGHSFDAANRCCKIDARNDVGRDLNRLFLGFISREFGADAFQVESVSAAVA